MAPFRWPEYRHELALAKEVAQQRPEKRTDWEDIAERLSVAFSSTEKNVKLAGRGCREKMERILDKYKAEDSKSLKRSGIEEEITELEQLCDDILAYRRDMAELQKAEKESKKNKEENDKKKAEEMRKAAVERLAKRRKSDDQSDEDVSSAESEVESTDTIPSKGPKKKVKKRASKLSAMEMLADKYSQKADYKKQELEIRRIELEFAKETFAAEAQERT